MAALLLLSFGLRVHRIGEQRVWWDEGWSVWAARFSTLDILRQTGNDVHPPLYFEALHLWRMASGDSEAGLRLLSAFLGTLTVAATYTLGRAIGRSRSDAAGHLVGALAALFLAVSRFAIAWSQEIRMYALASFLAVLALWAARRVWERGRPIDAALYVFSVTAGLYTLYLFAPVWVAVNVACLWEVRRAFVAQGSYPVIRTQDKNPVLRLGRWVVLQFVILALFLPWVWYAAGGFLSTTSAAPIRLVDFLHIYWTVLTVGIPLDVAQFNRLTLPALAIFVTAVGALIVAALRATRGKTNAERRATSKETPVARDLALLLAVLLLPALIVYVVSLPKQNFYNPPFSPRYLVIFTSFYSILLAWGLVTLGELMKRRGAGEQGSRGAGGKWQVAGGRWQASNVLTVLLAGVMVGVALVGLWPYYPGRVLLDDYPSLVSTIDAHRQPGDAVILYTDTDWPIFAYHHPAAWRGVPHLWTITPETAADYLAPIWEAHDAVWLVTTPYSAAGDPQRHVPAWLAARATAVREFTYQDMALTLYARTEERAAMADRLATEAPPHPLDVPLAGGGRLVGYGQAARDFKSGDVIYLFLYWQSAGPLDTEVGLLDEQGQRWGTAALSLPAAPENGRRQVDLVVPSEAPDGRYRFFIEAAGQQPAAFGALTLRQKQAAFLTEANVTITRRVDASFAGGIRLLGYDLAAGRARPGEPVGLTLYWTSEGGIGQTYKVFTHLLGDVFNATSGNFLWGQSDSEPAANTRPTTTWRAGEVIVDEYAIPLAADAPAGVYRIEIGLYDPLTGQRLPLLDADGAPAADHLIVTTVDVAP